MEVIVDFVNRRIVERDKIETAVSCLDDGTYLIKFDKLPMKHSDAQRNYFHSIVIKHYQDLWRDVLGHFHKDIVKGILKKKFLSKVVYCDVTEEEIEIVQDTRDLSVSDYDLFLQRCRLYYQNETGEILPYTPYYRGAEQ